MESEKRHRLRHCMVVLAYYPGGETRVQREAEALIARGHEVDLICLRGQEEPIHDSHRGVQIYRLSPFQPHSVAPDLSSTLRAYVRFVVRALVELTRLHRRRHYDVVQVHNLPDFLVFSALFPKLRGVPIILDLHDLMPEFYAGRGGGEDSPRWLERLVFWQEKLSCRFADHVITVSEHWRKALIRRGVEADRCSVVMNVADERIFRPQEQQTLPREDRAFRLIYHGTIVYRYGLDLAIQAIDLVRHDIPDVHLTISGSGDYVPELLRLVSALGLENHVSIQTGLRPLEELPKLIQANDVGVVPYRNDVFTDGIVPTKLMEYVALGLPCVAARTTAIESYFGSLAELFEPGDVGDMARHILMLYRSPERLKELSQACRGFQQRYNWTRFGGEYVDLVERLAGQALAARGRGSVKRSVVS